MPGNDPQTAARILRDASNLLVLTGAGVSRESGIPTFRDRDGLWNRYDPAELATLNALPFGALERVGAFLERADVILVVGTSAVVQPVASFPFSIAARGGRVVEVTLEETPLTAVADVSLRGRAGEILPELVRHVRDAASGGEGGASRPSRGSAGDDPPGSRAGGRDATGEVS